MSEQYTRTYTCTPTDIHTPPYTHTHAHTDLCGLVVWVRARAVTSPTGVCIHTAASLGEGKGERGA